MNRQIINKTLLAIIVSLFVCCGNNNDNYYFNGGIKYFDDSQKIVKNITSKSLSMESGVPFGMIAVYDSLLICWSSEYRDNFFNIINVDTGEEIGFFVNRGRGPREVLSVGKVDQLFKKENDICTFLGTYNPGRLFIWNISQSVEKGVTVYDTIIAYEMSRAYEMNRYRYLFYKPPDTLFFNMWPNPYYEEHTIQFYEKRTISTQKVIKEYRFFKNISLNMVDARDIELLFYTWDIIKPDGSKIAQVMHSLPQINILDTHTGNVIGYRMKNSPDFSLFKKYTDTKTMNRYFTSIHADNNYIYATYWGKEVWNGMEFPYINIIHVFDWNGKQLYELITDRSFFHIWVDQVRNRLYTIDMNIGDVYYLDLNELDL